MVSQKLIVQHFRMLSWGFHYKHPMGTDRHTLRIYHLLICVRMYTIVQTVMAWHDCVPELWFYFTHVEIYVHSTSNNGSSCLTMYDKNTYVLDSRIYSSITLIVGIKSHEGHAAVKSRAILDFPKEWCRKINRKVSI